MSNAELAFIEGHSKLVKFYRENPIIAAEDLLNVELVVPQRRVLTDMWFKNFVLVSAGRGVGKTFINAVLACLWALLYPGQKVGLLAPSFRQSKMIFAEVEKIWSMAPLFREATERKPIRQSDRCLVTFRQAGNRPASVIESVPLGDGSKIRGARYYLIIADEFAQIPVDIFNTVIVPMGATVANPIENVKRVAFQKRLVERGLASEEDFQEITANKIVMTSSAFFQFNHMYETLLSYDRQIREGDTRYATHRISFRDMPEGFLSDDNISNAKSRLSSIEFRMEYEAIWEADSAGVFKASLLEKCKAKDFSVKTKGNPGRDYVLGVDPARTSDAFALCLIELGTPNKVVGAWEYYRKDFPTMANTVMQLCNDFNVISIHMDAAGGGLAVKDLLEEEARWGAPNRILDADDEEKAGLTGRRILHLANFSPRWISEAVYASLNLLEKDGLYFPRRPQPTGTGELAFKIFDEEEEVYETVERMLRQMLLIEASESRSGVAHFDVPSGGGHASQKKDLYTAFILAAKQVYDMTVVHDVPEGILEVGIVEKRPDFALPQKNTLDKHLEVLSAPVNSWGFRKNFKPGG